MNKIVKIYELNSSLLKELILATQHL